MVKVLKFVCFIINQNKFKKNIGVSVTHRKNRVIKLMRHINNTL